jgi:hypothetical protein
VTDVGLWTLRSPVLETRRHSLRTLTAVPPERCETPWSDQRVLPGGIAEPMNPRSETMRLVLKRYRESAVSVRFGEL